MAEWRASEQKIRLRVGLQETVILSSSIAGYGRICENAPSTSPSTITVNDQTSPGIAG